MTAAESSRLEYLPRNIKNNEDSLFSPRNADEKSTSPESNLVFSARLKKKKDEEIKKKKVKAKNIKPDGLFKFGGDSLRAKKEQEEVPPIPE